MRCWMRTVSVPQAVSCAFLRAVLLLLLWCLPGAATEPSPPEAQLPLQEAFYDDELPPLTAAQQEARQLATVLIGKKQPVTTATIPKTPFVLLAEQSLRPGKRLVIVLFTWRHGQTRLVSGQQTFVSPIDEVASISAGARRSIPAHMADIALAVEVLVD